jgi:uncharacterized membrane protein YoaK (UPF0700 family)
MTGVFREAWHVFVPGEADQDGPLPGFLLALTLVTGLVDAFSYLLLGHVFVANMTGNVVFLGFGLAGASDFSIATSIVAILAFAVGAVAGGRLGRRLGTHRGRLLAYATVVEALLVGVAAITALNGVGSELVRYAIVVALAIAMGVQNATARRLAVADLTTTVLTLTITGLAADGRFGAGGSGRAGRRGLAVLAMLIGAALGAVLIVGGQQVLVLVLALGLTGLIAAGAAAVSRSAGPWADAANPPPAGGATRGAQGVR